MRDDQHRKQFEAYEDICNMGIGIYLLLEIKY